MYLTQLFNLLNACFLSIIIINILTSLQVINWRKLSFHFHDVYIDRQGEVEARILSCSGHDNTHHHETVASRGGSSGPQHEHRGPGKHQLL